MKKLSILSLCLIAGLTASAQKAVVKEANDAMKSGKPFSEVVKIITPAFSDPTTDKSAETYYIPGKAGFKEYDDLLGKRSLGRAPEDAPVTMANSLLGGYDYFMKALPLDSLPDAKGKVKPKYSKDIYNVITGHFNDFNTAAVDLWNAKDYNGAYNSWAIYIDIAQDPRFAKALGAAVPADTLLAETYFNQALAAWQADSLQKALNSFRAARKLGFQKKNLFEYGIGVAISAKDNDALMEFAQAGNELYGKDDIQFLNQIINYYLQTEKYAEALDYLSKGIAENPNNPQYYALRGIIFDNQKKSDDARKDYEKALQLDPKNALGLFYLGRNIAATAGSMQDAYDKADFDTYKKNTIDPMYRDAVKYLEDAYTVDENNRSEVLKLLNILYYNLNDEAGMESVKKRQLED